MPQSAQRYLVPTLILLLGAAGAYTIRRSAPADSDGIDLSVVPLEMAGFYGIEGEPDESVFAYLGADQMLERSYTNPSANQRAEVSIVFARGWRALHSPRECFKNQGWNTISEQRTSIGEPIVNARQLVMSNGGDRIATSYTFVTGDQTTGSWFVHSARMAGGGSRIGGALVVAVLSSESSASDTEVLAAADALVHAATIELQNAWRGAGKVELSGES